MATADVPQPAPFGYPVIHALRLASGQVLWVYIACHFTNHALGLVSLRVADGALGVVAAIWQSWPGTVVLYGAFLVHLTLALTGLWQRHTLRLPPAELARIGFGLTIPLLLVGHVVATRVAYSWYGEAAEYQRVVANLARDGNRGWQLALLAPGWLHGCMGLNVAFRHRDWYRRWKPWLIGAVAVLPFLAAAGYWAMLTEVTALGYVEHRVPASPEQRAALQAFKSNLLNGYFAVLGLLVFARIARSAWRMRAGQDS